MSGRWIRIVLIDRRNGGIAFGLVVVGWRIGNERRPVVVPIGIVGKGRVDQALVGIGEDGGVGEHVESIGYR